jgi:hypothetical protein
MWSFVGKKGNQRWLWHAIDHHTGKVLAYVFGRRKDEVFLQLKALLIPQEGTFTLPGGGSPDDRPPCPTATDPQAPADPKQSSTLNKKNNG